MAIVFLCTVSDFKDRLWLTAHVSDNSYFHSADTQISNEKSFY